MTIKQKLFANLSITLGLLVVCFGVLSWGVYRYDQFQEEVDAVNHQVRSWHILNFQVSQYLKNGLQAILSGKNLKEDELLVSTTEIIHTFIQMEKHLQSELVQLNPDQQQAQARRLVDIRAQFGLIQEELDQAVSLLESGKGPLALKSVKLNVIDANLDNRFIQSIESALDVEELDEARIKKSLAQLKWRWSLIFGLLCFVSLSITFLLVSRINRSVRRAIEYAKNELLRGTESIALGQLDIQVTANAQDELSVVTDAFNKMASSLNSARIQAEERSKRIELLVGVAIAANESDSLESAFQATLRLVCDSTELSIGHALIRSSSSIPAMVSSGIWYSKQAVDLSRIQEATNQIQFTSGVGLPGLVLAVKQVKWVSDDSDETSLPRQKLANELGCRSAIAFPIFLQHEVVAVMEFFTESTLQPESHLMEIMESVGIQIGRVLERVSAQSTILERDAEKKSNQAKSQFLANMSHELRTPMHGILSFAHFGQTKIETASKEKLKSYFDEIHDSGTRLMSLLNNLLDLAKLEAGKVVYSLEEANLMNSVSIVLREMNALAEEHGIGLTLLDQSVEVRCVFDAEKIMQVMRNLISNALKFSEKGSLVKLVLEPSREAVRFRVINHGIGIPDAELESIFDKFVQSSKTRTGAGGTGLGLAICREIMNQHGGKIWAENGDGATHFVFELPRTQTQTTDQVA